MPLDAVRLQARLARKLHDLHQLQVVEAAEDIVRSRQLQLLASQAAGLRDDLISGRQRLDLARDGSDLRLIVEWEETVCGILRQLIAVQCETGEHIRACRRARNLYLARSTRMSRSIDLLRRLIA